jgi:hypothetical protein
MQDSWDATAPALYYDQSLFSPGTPASSALLGTANLRAVRTGSPNGPAAVTGATVGGAPTGTAYIFTRPQFAPVGPLLGLQVTDSLPTDYPAVNDVSGGTAYYGAHFGGGILGSTPFLLLNVNENVAFKSDGGVAMPRKWSRAVFTDLLCRDLPVARSNDVSQFVDSSSAVPFRQTQGCVQCHASMDRMAMALRNFTYLQVGLDATAAGADFPLLVPPTQPAEPVPWAATPDPQYYLRPPSAVLFFRDLHGDLVNVNVSGISGVAQELARHDDYYVCLAKHYYKYFLGVDVPLRDPDPSSPGPNLSAQDAQHLNDVMVLGRQLHTDQQTARWLVEQILRLPAYADSGFDTTTRNP